MFPNKFVWLIGVDVEFVLPCRSDPLGRHGDESEQETLDPVRGSDDERRMMPTATLTQLPSVEDVKRIVSLVKSIIPW